MVHGSSGFWCAARHRCTPATRPLTSLRGSSAPGCPRKKATETVISFTPETGPVTYVFEPEIMIRDSVRDISGS